MVWENQHCLYCEFQLSVATTLGVEGLFLTVLVMDGRYETDEVSLYSDSSRWWQISADFAFNIYFILQKNAEKIKKGGKNKEK